MGKLFVIDGTDGSGKQTQFEELKKRLDRENIEYKTVSFPNYDSPSSSLVKMYLSGEFGEDPKAVNAYVASTFYAADRFATFKKNYEEYYKNGGIILADRYTTANMVHQAGKITDAIERDKFLEWLWDFEFSKLGLPEPDLVLYLELPPKLSLSLVKSRSQETGQKMDIHEKDTAYMDKCYEAALYSCERLGWKRVKCYNGDTIRTRDDIFEEIYKEASKL